jgi:RimJ/RimL family protein N-acetyltransferase
MLILTDGPLREVAALAARLTRQGVSFLDMRGLGLSHAAVRDLLAETDDESRAWLVTVPADCAMEDLALRCRRPRERVLAATRLNAGDLGTLVADASPVADAPAVAPRIHTARLLLSWPDAAQIDDYYRAILGTDMVDTLLWDGPDDLHDYWHQCRQTSLDGPGVPLSVAVIDKATGRYVGGAALRPIGGNPEQIDVGYAFAPHAHGRGFATEAVGALVHEAFAVRGAERIIATVFVGNQASRSVTEKLGFVCEGVLRAAVRKRGALLDEWLMAITRPDWEARQAGTTASGASAR